MSEMTDWFSSNEAAVQAISSIIQGVAVVALVAVTGVYAYFTRRMARELREQTLAQDRPDLLIDIVEIREPDWYLREVHEKSGAKVEPYAYHDVVCWIHNAGRHAAKEVAATIMRPNVTFHAPRKGFLLPEDTWETNIGACRGGRARDEPEPCGLIEWSAEQGHHILKPEPPPEQSFPTSVISTPLGDTGVVVCYRDIHDTDWATYLTFEVIQMRDANTGRLIKLEVVVGDQRRIKVKYRRLPPETLWV